MCGAYIQVQELGIRGWNVSVSVLEPSTPSPRVSYAAFDTIRRLSADTLFTSSGTNLALAQDLRLSYALFLLGAGPDSDIIQSIRRETTRPAQVCILLFLSIVSCRV